MSSDLKDDKSVDDLLKVVDGAVGDILFAVAYDVNRSAVMDNLKRIQEALSAARDNLQDGPAVSRIVLELDDDLRDLRDD